jgi:hypothetical protein
MVLPATIADIRERWPTATASLVSQRPVNDNRFRHYPPPSRRPLAGELLRFCAVIGMGLMVTWLVATVIQFGDSRPRR